MERPDQISRDEYRNLLIKTSPSEWPKYYYVAAAREIRATIDFLIDEHPEIKKSLEESGIALKDDKILPISANLGKALSIIRRTKSNNFLIEHELSQQDLATLNQCVMFQSNIDQYDARYIRSVVILSLILVVALVGIYSWIKPEPQGPTNPPPTEQQK